MARMIDLGRMCGGKTRFDDKRAVLTYLNRYRRELRGRHGRPEELRPYPCPNCRGWHLTKR